MHDIWGHWTALWVNMYAKYQLIGPSDTRVITRTVTASGCLFIQSKAKMLRDFIYFTFVPIVRGQSSIQMINAICLLKSYRSKHSLWRMRLGKWLTGRVFCFLSNRSSLLIRSCSLSPHTSTQPHTAALLFAGWRAQRTYTFLFKNSIYHFISIWYAYECELIARCSSRHIVVGISFASIHFILIFFCSISLSQPLLKIPSFPACWHRHQHSMASSSLLSLLHRP